MKALPKLLFLSAVLALAGCGKNNESGKSNGGRYSSKLCVAYDMYGNCSQYQNVNINNVNSNYSYGGVSLNTVQAENPCILSGNGYYGQTNFNRQAVQSRVQAITAVNGSPTVVPNGDMYVGVTSFGDVAAVIGNGTNSPLFVAYLCPRPVSGQASPPVLELAPMQQIPNVVMVRPSTQCRVKSIQATTIFFGDGTKAAFRMLEGGSSRQTKFSFCNM